MAFASSAHSNARLAALLLTALALSSCTLPTQTARTPARVPDAQRSADAPVRWVEVRWSDVPGWDEDPLEAAWPAFLRSCTVLKRDSVWQAPCAEALTIPLDSGTVRRFLEARFRVYACENASGASSGLFTGYYEPILSGSRSYGAPFTVPLYGVPDDLVDVELGSEYPQLKGMRLRGRLEGRTLVPYWSRADIAQAPGVEGKALVWVSDAIAAFFMEIQGSGRIRLADAPAGQDTIRLSYADQNGHPYKAIGRWLVDQGEMPLEQVSMQSIVAWARAHPDRSAELLAANPSVVFFTESPIEDETLGARGALGVPLTPGRSIAVDPRVVKLGAPVFLEIDAPDGGPPWRRLVMAQDTGGAIAASPERPARADVFVGTGDAAGALAGRMKQAGRMWMLLPRDADPASEATRR